MSKTSTHELFHAGESFFDLGLELFWVGALVLVEESTDFGGECEPRRDWESQLGHAVKVSALSSEKIFLFFIAFRFASSEGVDELLASGKSGREAKLRLDSSSRIFR